MDFSAVHRSVAFALLALAASLPVAAASSPAAPSRIDARMLDGSPYSLAASRGAITVISIWSPDSLSSRKCIWELQRFSSAYESHGVRTLAISTTTDADALHDIVTQRKLSLPVGVLGDHDLGMIDEMRLPLVYVFDADGQLRATHAGLYSLRVLEAMVAPYLSR